MSAGGAVDALWSLDLPDSFVVENYHGAHAAFYDQMIRRHDGGLTACLERIHPEESVLDLACGTGRLLARLAARGNTVTGVDAAPDMLDRARARLGREQLDARLEVGDVRTWTANGRYDVVTLVGLTLSLFDDRADRVAILRTAVRHLRPGGRVLVDFLPLTGELASLQHWAVGVRIGPMRGRALVEVRRDPAKRTQIADIYTQLSRTDRRCVHLRSTTVSTLLPTADVLEVATACGLRVVSSPSGVENGVLGCLLEMTDRRGHDHTTKDGAL